MRRLAALLAMVAVLLACGCAAKQPAPGARPGAPPASAARAAPALPPGEKPDLDEKVLPPPRPDLAATPDLSRAVYAINAATLNSMANGGVPADALKGLRKLDGKTYANTAVFLAAAKDAVGQATLDNNREAILLGALVVTLAEPPPAPAAGAVK